MRLSHRNKSTAWLSLCLVGLVVSACEPTWPAEGSIFDGCFLGETSCDDPVAIEVVPTHDTLTAGRVDTVSVRVRWPSGWYNNEGASWDIRDTTTVMITGCVLGLGFASECGFSKSQAWQSRAVEITALRAGETWLVVQRMGLSTFRLVSDSALVVVTPAM